MNINIIDSYKSWLVDMFIIKYLLQGYEKPKLFFLGSVPSQQVDRKCPANYQKISMIVEFFEISKQ